jgi:D-lactate dehydrogenase
VALRRDPDLTRLPEPFRAFHRRVAGAVPPERIFADPLRTLAFGTDASFYRLIPRLVVQARTGAEVASVLSAATSLKVPVTFRAAGTSLSGQAVTDSVLVVLAGGWRAIEVLDGGARIRLQPGVIGSDANAALARLGRKIGPDPASIQSCMIGGIAANNSSGMCCGTAQSCYQTVESMRLLLWDGTWLDTAAAGSRRAFAESHPEVIRELCAIRDELAADAPLRARIVEKYRIKNTTGYSLNAFVDHVDPVDILLHLMVGSEGTLGFIAEVTLRTVPDPPHRASALALFPDVASACRAVVRLQGGPAAAAELMDRASLRAVQAKPGMPEGLAALPPEAAALLVETRAVDPAELAEKVAEAQARLAAVPALAPIAFTSVREELERLWDVRRGLFPAVGAARPVGTTVVIEDVAFPTRVLAEATLDLQSVLRRHGYSEAILFGHALDGNLHFVFTQDFGTEPEVERYGRLMDAVAELVVDRYGGSLKAEHGTGRNMAPFVEREWGAQAYALMRRVKRLLDPHQVLNPGVVIGDRPRAHLENLKPLPRVDPLVDGCIECGACEPRCPSRDLSLSPRQRIVVQREIARERAAGGSARGRRLEEDFVWAGDQTCATDGLCATACPVSIDTGLYVKSLRAAAHQGRTAAAQWVADHFAGVTSAVRALLGGATLARRVLGARALGAISSAARTLSGGRLPLWNRAMPRPVRGRPWEGMPGEGAKQVVYFPSCVARTLGEDPDAGAGLELSAAVRSLLSKAGFQVRVPERVEGLCCGMAFESKGYPEQGRQKLRELEAALLAAGDGGRIPVLCDTSPCVQRMRKAIDPRLKVFEPVEFIHDFLLPELRLERRPGPIAIHLTCSSQKLGVGPKLRALAAACADEVVVPPVGCCGFAGDKGFTHPELNASALAGLAEAIPVGCRSGYSNSRGCEVGLSLHAGIPYRSVVQLVDACARPLRDPEPRPGG